MSLRRLAVDVGIVVALVAATAAYVRTPQGWMYFVHDAREIDKLGGPTVYHTGVFRWWSASAVGMAAVLVRGRLPLVTLAGTVAMALVHVASNVMPLLPLDLAVVIAVYTVAAGPARRPATAALTAALALSFLPAWWVDMMPAVDVGGGAVGPPAAIALAWFFGSRTRNRQERAAQRARQLERERDDQADIAAAAERARLGRELHDAVAHGLSIIVIQAQAAAGALDKRPVDTRTGHDMTARTALDAIENTGRDSLIEMRRLLGLDRPDHTDAVLPDSIPTSSMEFAPLPGAVDLPALAARVRAAGLPVDLRVHGDLTALPTGVGLSAYRIVQEALTNALKHAGPHATVHIDVCRESDAVELTIADSGRGAGGAPDELRGNGLRGMRERVALLGGTFAAGDNTGGGFRVQARLPLESAAP